MISKKYRIPKKSFKTVYDSNQFLNTPIFFARFSKSNEKHSRICFSISKKISKKAVLRNKMRRAGYRAVSGIIETLNNPVMVVFSFRKIPERIDEVKKEVHAIITKIQNLK